MDEGIMTVCNLFFSFFFFSTPLHVMIHPATLKKISVLLMPNAYSLGVARFHLEMIGPLLCPHFAREMYALT
jgi:hypothetical protein